MIELSDVVEDLRDVFRLEERHLETIVNTKTIRHVQIFKDVIEYAYILTVDAA